MTANAPILLVEIRFEEPAVVIVLASTAEDEARLVAWLANPAAKNHVIRTVEATLDGLAQRRAA